MKSKQDRDVIYEIYRNMKVDGRPAPSIRKIIFHATPSRDNAVEFLNDKIEARVPDRFSDAVPAVYFTQGVSQSLEIMHRIYGELDTVYIASVDSTQLDRKKFFLDPAAAAVNGVMYLDDVPSAAVIKVDVYEKVRYKKYELVGTL